MNTIGVNFDGKTLEQHFTQVFEERLNYKNAEGEWVTNILQVPQKTDPNWWEELRNKENKINAIVDSNKAKTAYAVNGNHSNDATLVKQYHLWGKKNKIQTSTVHDAFFANAADMLSGREALQAIYGDMVDRQSVKATLDEMRARGLPKELYDKYLNEAIDIGIIPVAGRSSVGGKILKETDILKRSDVVKPPSRKFDSNLYFYGVG